MWLPRVTRLMSHRSAISSHIHLSISASTSPIACDTRCRVVGRENVDSVFHVSPRVIDQRREVWRPWWPRYWSASSNPNRYCVGEICCDFTIKVWGAPPCWNSSWLTRTSFIRRPHSFYHIVYYTGTSLDTFPLRHTDRLNKAPKPRCHSLSLWWIFPVHSYGLSLQGSARSRLIKPQKTLRASRTVVIRHDYWMVHHVLVHFA
jgi:hypothetical protein